MKRKRLGEEKFDLLAYGLLTFVILLFILGFMNNLWNLMAVLALTMLAICTALLLRLLKNRKTVRQAEQLLEWIRRGDFEDLEGLPEEYREIFWEMKWENAGRRLETSAEYAALQNQINPHFLYNTLDAIRGQALEENVPEIAEMTGKLSRFFRYSIKNRGALVTVADEIANVQDYFSIEKYRFEDRFSLDIRCEDPAIYRFYLPKLTFQPLVENAIFHGLEPKKGPGRVTIRMERMERTLLMIVSDDGCGMDEETLDRLRARMNTRESRPVKKNGRSTGIALSNVHQRLRLLFGAEYGLSVTSMPGQGTDVEIRLPLVDESARSLYQTEVER